MQVKKEVQSGDESVELHDRNLRPPEDDSQGGVDGGEEEQQKHERDNVAGEEKEAARSAEAASWYDLVKAATGATFASAVRS